MNTKSGAIKINATNRFMDSIGLILTQYNNKYRITLINADAANGFSIVPLSLVNLDANLTPTGIPITYPNENPNMPKNNAPNPQ